MRAGLSAVVRCPIIVAKESRMIGIRLADRSVFPVFPQETPGSRHLVLTTARDQQERVEIQLVRSLQENTAGSATETTVIGRVELGDLALHGSGEPEIDLNLELEPDGILDISLTDRESGNSESVSIDVYQASAEASRKSEFDLDDGFAPSATVYEEERPAVPPGPPEPRRRPWGLIAFVGVLALLLLILLAWWLLGSSDDSPTPVSTMPEDRETMGIEPAEPEQPAEEPAPPEEQQDPPETPAADAGPRGATEYRIRRGDTLWDISQTFYGTPWRFPELAEWNSIPNPDLIYAEDNIDIPADQ
jgi:hypothetical protein